MRRGRMTWAGGSMCGAHQRVLDLLFRHGAADIRIIGEAATCDIRRTRLEDDYYRPRDAYLDRKLGRIGGAALIWLKKWGFVRPHMHEGRRYWAITDEGRRALAVARGEQF